MPLGLNPVTGELDLKGVAVAAGASTDLTGDSGGAVSPDGSDSITLIGDATQAFISTIGTPASNKMEIKLVEPAVDGQLLIGHTANGEPSAATLTAGSGIDITNGAGSITIASTASSALVMPTDSGTGTAVAGSMDMFGGTGISTSASGNTITITADAAVPTTFSTDSGSAVPAGNTLNVSGGTGVNTSGTGSTLTVNIDSPVIVANGGTGRTSHTAYAVLCGGTTSTGAQQSIASVGTANQLLTSNGAGALPTFQDAPAVESLPTSLTAGSIVFSDGTNLAEDNSNLFWDDTNNRMGIGQNSTLLDTLNITGTILLTHTATETDDHALEIDCDAAGFGDVKAIDVVYTSGAVTAGSTEEAILINIDETASVGGEIFGMEVLSTDLGSAEVYGVKHGATINPVLQASGTFGDMDSVLNKAVDVTAALSDGGAGNISVFVADNDTITIGDAATFGEMEIIVDTGASGSGVAPTFEYSTGVGTWSTFSPTDGTNGFRNTGIIIWDIADIPTWATGTGSEYLIRITRTRNSLSTTPILDEIQIAAITEYKWDKNGLFNIDKVVAQTNLTVGNTTEDTSFTVNGAAVTSTISAESENSSTLGGLISHRHSSTAGFGGHYLGLRSRGTHASPTVVQDNDTLSIMASAGHDGTDYALAAQISVEVDGTPGADDMPGRIILSTSADGAQTPTEGFRLDSSQNVTLANALTVANGGTGLSSTTAYAVLCGGTTSTAALQSVASVGTSGQVLTSNGAGALPTFQAVSGPAGGSLTQSLVYSDFTEGLNDQIFTFTLDSSADGTADHPGIIAGSSGQYITTNTKSFVIDGGVMVFECVTKQRTTSSASSSVARYGFCDELSGNPGVSDQIAFEIDRDGGETTWRAVTESSSTATRTDTSVTDDTSWHTFRIEVNAAGTSVEFFIDGSSVATNTTNIPTVAMYGLMNLHGNAAPCADVDALLVHKTFDGDRA